MDNTTLLIILLVVYYGRGRWGNYPIPRAVDAAGGAVLDE